MPLPGRYPDAFAELVGVEVAGPWMYTGGLENHPDLVRRMARQRPLWGGRPDGVAAAIGSGYTLPEWGHPTFCC